MGAVPISFFVCVEHVRQGLVLNKTPFCGLSCNVFWTSTFPDTVHKCNNYANVCVCFSGGRQHLFPANGIHLCVIWTGFGIQKPKQNGPDRLDKKELQEKMRDGKKVMQHGRGGDGSHPQTIAQTPWSTPPTPLRSNTL